MTIEEKIKDFYHYLSNSFSFVVPDENLVEIYKEHSVNIIEKIDEINEIIKNNNQ